MAISHFQTLLNEIISSDTINSANLAVHEESYEDIIEEAKSLARKICPHDAKA